MQANEEIGARRISVENFLKFDWQTGLRGEAGEEIGNAPFARPRIASRQESGIHARQSDEIAQIRQHMCPTGGDRFKILMTHHPFIPPPGDRVHAIDLLGRAAEALPVLDECGVDLLLAGHLHHGYSGDVRTFYPATSRSIVVVQAGTAISRRIRTEPNGYNILRLDRTTIEVEVRLWNGTAFVKDKRAIYRQRDKEWTLQHAER